MIFVRNSYNQKGRSFRFYKYFLSYVVLVVSILLIISIVVYRNFIFTLQTEVEIANTSVLTQIQNTMDTRIKEMERTAVNISLNPELKPYKVSAGGYDSLEAVRELGKYKSSNEFLYDIAICYNQQLGDRIFSTNMNTNLATFFTYIYKYENWGQKEFLDTAKELSMPVMRPVEPVFSNGVDHITFATYLYPIPMNTIKTHGVAVFFIQGSVLRNMISNALKEYEGYVYVFDEKNNPIVYLSKGGMELPPLRMLENINMTSLKDKINNVSIGKQKYSIIKLTSEYNRWSYVTVTPTDQLMRKVYTNRNLFNYAALAVLIAGIAIAFAFASEHYKPLRKLIDSVSGNSESMRGTAITDEFDYISKVIQEASDENKSLLNQLRSKAGIMKEQMLLRLLNGKLESMEDIKNMGDLLGVKLEYPYFVVLLFSIDNYSSLKEENDEKLRSLILFSIINVIEELAQEVGCGYGIDLVDGRGIALLINSKAEYAEEQAITALADKAKEFFKQHFAITLTVGVGSIYADSKMICQSFTEANRAAYYRLIKGHDHVIFYKEIKDSQKEEYKYPVELETELTMAIKQGKSEEVEKITRNLNRYIINRTMSPEAAQCICFGIINAVMKSLDEIDVDMKECFRENDENLHEQPFETINDLGDRLVHFCNKVCSYIQQRKESKNFELRDRIMEVMDRRFQDKALCLELIADECGFSPSYVSRYFKDQTGQAISQYIDTLRMNEAKRLLKGTKISLREILDQIGYIDESSFIRKFKKREGTTPMQYRSISQSEPLHEKPKGYTKEPSH